MKEILKSADIFVLKALYDYKVKTEDGRMLEAYLKNIDIVNGTTRKVDGEQMLIPKIMHNVSGRGGVSKKHYGKALTEISKDNELEGVEYEISAMTKIPKTFAQKFPIFGMISDWFADRREAKREITSYEDRRMQEEEKIAKGERAEKDAKDKRERKLEKSRINKEKKERKAEDKKEKAERKAEEKRRKAEEKKARKEREDTPDEESTLDNGMEAERIGDEAAQSTARERLGFDYIDAHARLEEQREAEASARSREGQQYHGTEGDIDLDNLMEDLKTSKNEGPQL